MKNTNIKKYIPVAGLVLLTVGLMIYFKSNDPALDIIIKNHKNAVSGFYAENLKPLLSKSTIEDEDVFNFAVYNNLSIDKAKNRVVKIIPQENNREIIQLKEEQGIEKTNNYYKFIKYLDLKDKEKKKLDSLMESYKELINNYILHGDDNTIAVNSKINILNQALRADLLRFTEKYSRVKSGEVFIQQDFDEINPIVAKMRSSVIDSGEGNFVVFTNDSIFNVKLDLKFSKTAGHNLLKIIPLFPAEELIRYKELHKNIKLAELECPEVPDIGKEEILRVKKELKAASDRLKTHKFKIKSNAANYGDLLNFAADAIIDGDDTTYVFSLKVNLFDQSNQELNYNEWKKKDWEEFGLLIDSLSGGLNMILNDSTFKLNAEGIEVNIKSN
jgi:hypothetical protein